MELANAHQDTSLHWEEDALNARFSIAYRVMILRKILAVNANKTLLMLSQEIQVNASVKPPFL